MKTLRFTCLFLPFFLVSVTSLSKFAVADDFKPISREELEMKDNPAAPGTHAMILEWTDEQDDNESREDEYFRIKIFTDKGKKYGDVEIPYYNDRFTIGNIKARTVQPDGTIVPFTAKIFDKMLVKAGSFKIKAKTFSLPDVRPGSIVEYRYRRTWDSSLLYNANWELQRNLFIRKAKLVLKPYLKGAFFATYITVGVPKERQPVSTAKDFVLELRDVAEFQEEKLTLPESQLKPRVDFFYRTQDSKTPDDFWMRYGKETYRESEDFIGKRSGIKQAVNLIIGPADNAEAKLRKIYSRVQQIRNLSYEETKTTQEVSRITPKDNKNVEDVLRNGYGYRREINRLFVAMVRAAGLESNVVRVSQRDAQLFQRALLDDRQLDSEIAIAQSDAKEILLDPGTPFCPFGLLSWENTGITALRLDKDGGAFFQTAQPASQQAVLRRKADLKLDEDGGFKGKIEVEYEGQFALRRRLNALESDEAEQKKDHEERLEGWLPSGSKAKLIEITGNKDSEKPLHIRFEVEIPSVASSVGSRTLAPILVFQAQSSNPFEFAKRIHPIYFDFPYQEIDSVKVTLPEGLKIESLPKATVIKEQFAFYDNSWQQQGNTVMATRREAMGAYMFDLSFYNALRSFFEKVNNGDKENVVLRAAQ
jgi:hypothetical protein